MRKEKVREDSGGKNDLGGGGQEKRERGDGRLTTE